MVELGEEISHFVFIGVRAFNVKKKKKERNNFIEEQVSSTMHFVCSHLILIV